MSLLHLNSATDGAELSLSNSKANISAEDQLGTISARSYSYGSNGDASASLQFCADGNWSGGWWPTRISFWTTSGATRIEQMRLTKDGKLGIGTTNPGSTLDVNGIITARVRANIGNDCEMISIGKTPGSSALAYSTSYIGFNAERISADEWLIRSDNLHNGGAVIYGTIGGDMIFSCIKTEADGSTDQSLTDTQIKDNAQMMLSQDGILKVNEVEVKLNIWSDYVFNEDYNLPKLS